MVLHRKIKEIFALGNVAIRTSHEAYIYNSSLSFQTSLKHTHTHTQYNKKYNTSLTTQAESLPDWGDMLIEVS